MNRFMNKVLGIGGEFWFEDKLQDKNIYNDISEEGVFLSGGKNAIEFILTDIEFKEDEILALPSYLCPTIINSIRNLGIHCEFYSIDNNLEINIDSLKNLINNFNIKAVFFINYFGFYHKNIVRKFLNNLKTQKIILIEDAVQNFWIKRQKKFIGDYIFNSYRKFLPIDGSLVLCNKTKEFNEIQDSYFKIVEKAREEKTRFISTGVGNEQKFLKLFNKAHKEYYKRENIFGINLRYKEFLNHLPVEILLNKRKENYKYLFKCLKHIQGIEPLHDIEELYDNTPLAFPIFLTNRDYVRTELMKNNIYAPVHWDLSHETWIKDFKNSLSISNRLLSLPIDWRYEIKDMEYLARNLECILM